MSVFWNAILCYLLFNDSETGEDNQVASEQSTPVTVTKSIEHHKQQQQQQEKEKHSAIANDEQKKRT
jgi:hypothetical protein